MKLRAVNLGNWFVLERWMKHSLFTDNQVEGYDETAFSQTVSNLHKVLDHHYQTWITKEDILWLKQIGVNLVRLPIPWWMYGVDVYHRSVEYIDQAIDMFEEVGMDYMLDLHTAPGCQNGFDNGGIKDVMEWHTKPEYINTTIDILEKIVKRYIGKPRFHSIGVLNEPNVVIDIEIIEDFYHRSYQRIREISKDIFIVFHDAFRLHAWKSFFTDFGYTNVILDTHMYQCFSENVYKLTVKEHVALAKKRKETLRKIEEYVPVIVGEWSLGLRPNEDINKDPLAAQKAYASAQLEGMRECSGHIFWSYKVENGYSGWSFRDLIERGVIELKEFLK
jgi:glucan 1,3-beta-glucosidase